MDKTALLESRAKNLVFEISAKLVSRIKSFQLMTDDDFLHRRDRTCNDIHAFLELQNGSFFHLRAYIKHMIEANIDNQIFLTGYLKSELTQFGGEHAFRQDWYPWDAKIISNEILLQNPHLFD